MLTACQDKASSRQLLRSLCRLTIEFLLVFVLLQTFHLVPDLQTFKRVARQTVTDSATTKRNVITCRVFRDISSDDEPAKVERTSSRSNVNADDPLDVIEVCKGERPVLLSSRFIDRSTPAEGSFIVPNIVHYIMPPGEPMTFLQYLSFLSAHRYIRPRYIFIHGQSVPHGDWWQRTVNDVANVFLVNSTAEPTHVYGIRLRYGEHRADLARIQIVYELGGIYLDADVLAFRSFDPLRNYSLTLGRDDQSLNNGVIIGRPGAPFIRLWLETYRTYAQEWGSHSLFIPYRLSKLFPDLVHVDEGSLINPIFDHRGLLHNGTLYNWTGQYSCHVWKRRIPAVPTSVDGIKRLSTTLGQMMRHVYFGRTDFV